MDRHGVGPPPRPHDGDPRLYGPGGAPLPGTAVGSPRGPKSAPSSSVALATWHLLGSRHLPARHEAESRAPWEGKTRCACGENKRLESRPSFLAFV
jgi:hypothetical protein